MATTHDYHPPVVEHHVHENGSDSSALMIVLLVAAVLIVGFLLFVMRAFPFNAVGTDSDSDINIDLPAVETTAPGSNMENNAPSTDY